MKIVPSSYVVSVASSTNKCRGAQENVTPQMNSIIFDAKICGLTTLRGNTPQPWPTCSGGTNHANGRNISTSINRPQSGCERYSITTTTTNMRTEMINFACDASCTNNCASSCHCSSNCADGCNSNAGCAAACSCQQCGGANCDCGCKLCCH